MPKRLNCVAVLKCTMTSAATFTYTQFMHASFIVALPLCIGQSLIFGGTVCFKIRRERENCAVWVSSPFVNFAKRGQGRWRL